MKAKFTADENFTAAIPAKPQEEVEGPSNSYETMSPLVSMSTPEKEIMVGASSSKGYEEVPVMAVGNTPKFEDPKVGATLKKVEENER